MNTMDDEMLNYDYNDPYSYSSTPGYVDYDSDLVEKPLPSTSTGPIFSPPYQSPYHLRESGPASPFSSQGYSYDSCPLSSCLSPRREPFLPAFSHGLHALHHLLLLPASLLRLPRLLRARCARPPREPAPPFNRAKPSPSFDPPLKSSPSYNSFPHASSAPRKTSPGVVHGARTEKRKSQRGQRVGHGAAAEGVSHAAAAAGAQGRDGGGCDLRGAGRRGAVFGNGPVRELFVPEAGGHEQ